MGDLYRPCNNLSVVFSNFVYLLAIKPRPSIRRSLNYKYIELEKGLKSFNSNCDGLAQECDDVRQNCVAYLLFVINFSTRY